MKIGFAFVMILEVNILTKLIIRINHVTLDLDKIPTEVNKTMIFSVDKITIEPVFFQSQFLEKFSTNIVSLTIPFATLSK